MTNSGGNIRNGHNNLQIRSTLIKEIATDQYGAVSPLLSDLIDDIRDLYQGKWESHEACQTGYHNLDHALDVALLTARMIGGWNKLNDSNHPHLDESIFLAAIASALFHDTGYIKNKGDFDGYGGKYSFSHEDRSMELAANYLAENNWPERLVRLVPNIISTTKFHGPLTLEGLFDNRQESVAGRMVATSDLVAQMADVDYMQRINDLYAELQEAYRFETKESLEERGIKVFSSAKEMIDGTVDFYEHFVLPRLQDLGRMDQYLVTFFGDGRNPYLENITANLSGQLVGKRSRWRRLGDILEDLGLVSAEQLKAALVHQKDGKDPSAANPRKVSGTSLRDRLLSWMEGSQFNEKCLGEILMEMQNIKPSVLRKGLLYQALPHSMITRMSRSELLFLLQISILLQSIGRGPWLFDQILEMTNELLNCEGSYILLADTENQEMLMAIPTGPNKEQLDGQTMPADKGLAGWVFSHGQPAIVNNVHQDDRFDSEIDSTVREGFDTKSVVAVPLHINGELIGVMEVVNKITGEFSSHDLDILTLLANVIAVSLDGVFRFQDFYT
ncbi:MAG: GAF domain-containing protein [Proteobacteria bacterium]|nr:GAF domain-containing protein [Pseudomonadota bacterium]MBU1739331.1 GAF domain-containing protein [Pseudomonadota bacterium]